MVSLRLSFFRPVKKIILWIFVVFSGLSEGADSFYWADFGGSGAILATDDDFTQTRTEVAASGSYTSGVAIAPKAERIFWTTRSAIYASPLGGGEPELIVDGLDDALGIVVHEPMGRIYWVDAGYRKVQSANFDGSDVVDLATEVGDVEGIAIDYKNNRLYWTDYVDGSIERSNLDGSNQEFIYRDPASFGPEDIAIDSINDKLYWVNYAGYLRRMDLDGQNVETLLTGLFNPIGIVVLPDQNAIYWVERGIDQIRKAELDGSNPQTVYSGSGNYVGITHTSIGADARAPIPSIQVAEDFPGDTWNERIIRAVKYLPDGSILYGGEDWSGNALGKLMADGNDDPDFFYSGLGDSLDGNAPSVLDLATLSDGRIIVVGNFEDWNGQLCNGVVLLDEDGFPDDFFYSGDGFSGVPSSVIVMENDRIVIGGDFSEYDGVSCRNIIRITPSGRIDSIFQPIADEPPGTDGPITDLAYSCNPLPSQYDQIYLCGEFNSFNGLNTAGGLMRINQYGKNDFAFRPNTGTEFDAIHLLASGDLVAASSNGDLIKYDAEGERIRGEAFFEYQIEQQTVHAISSDLKGNIYVAGEFRYEEALTRFRPNGYPDPFFRFNYPLGQTIYAMEISPSGALYLGGDLYPTENPHFGFMRLNPMPSTQGYTFSLDSTQISEAQPSLSLVGQFNVSGVAPDNSLQFELIQSEGNQSNWFRISRDELLSNQVFDFESRNSYTIDVRVYIDQKYLMDQTFEIEILNVTTDDDDDDGLTEAEENTLGTGPSIRDSDGDGAVDGTETRKGSSPTNPDSVPDNYVAVWGDYSVPQVPYDLGEVIAISGGRNHYMALLSDGSVRVWANSVGLTLLNVPENLDNVMAIEAGDYHCVALKQDGSVVLWGAPSHAVVPENNSGIVAIAAGYGFTLFLREDGTVTATGFNSSGVLDIPESAVNVVGVYANDTQCLALTQSGEIIKWGNAYYPSPSGIDSSGIVDLSVGFRHGLGLKADGSLSIWGNTRLGSQSVPAATPEGIASVQAIVAKDYHSMALLEDGSLRTWGGFYNGATYLESEIPIQIENVVDIAATYYSRAALSTTHWKRTRRIGSRQFSAEAEANATWSMAFAGEPINSVSALSLPSGLSIDSDTGTLSGSAERKGQYLSRLLLHSDTGGSQIVAFDISGYSFSTWQNRYFSTAEQADPSVGTASADANQNGYSNFEDYAMGFDPVTTNTQSSRTALASINSAGYLSLTYAYNPNADDVIRVPMTSVDLLEWLPANHLFSDPDESSIDQATIQLMNFPNESKRFFGIQVQQK